MSDVLEDLVLDRDGHIWRSGQGGWWRCLDRGLSGAVVLQRSELRAIYGPLRLLTPTDEPKIPTRKTEGSPPPPRRRVRGSY